MLSFSLIDYICIIAIAIGTGLLLVTIYFVIHYFYPDEDSGVDVEKQRDEEYFEKIDRKGGLFLSYCYFHFFSHD